MNKKCICKKCEDCRLYLSWDMENKEGLRKQVFKCVLMVVAEEIPQIKGSIDGCQQATNETRNRVLEFGQDSVNALFQIGMSIPKLLGRN